MCAFLAVMMIACTAIGCGDRGDGKNTDTNSNSDSAIASGDVGSTENVDQEGYIKDDIPEGITLSKNTAKILYWEDAENPEYFSEEEQSGNEVSDVLFKRNAKVEQRLGITFEFIPTLGDSGNANKYVNFVHAAIAGGEKYDIISAHSRSIGLCAYNGYTQDLRPLDYLDFEKPWWQDSLLTTATINDQLHFISGDISTNMLYMMYVVFFNKVQLASHADQPDPYNEVINGTWTIDKMIDMSRDYFVELDGILGKTDGDQYGQATTLLHADAFLWGCDILGFKTENKLLTLDESFTGEKCTNLIDYLYKYFCESDDGKLYESGSAYKTIFSEGRSLFITERADVAINDLGDKTFDMGILPIPKYDKDQKEYRTIIGNPFSLYAVPINAEDANFSACVLECLASESYRQVTPVIFEITMKTRYSTGSKDAQMYDYVRDGAVYDLSRIFWKVISAKGNAPDTLFEDQLLQGSNGWESTIKRNKRMLETIITNINSAFGG